MSAVATESPRLPRSFFVGGAYAVLAYLAWGLMPIYWKAVGEVSPAQMVAHRVLWSAVVTLGLIAWFRRGPALRATLASPRKLAVLATTTILVTGNWLIFVWAVQAGHVLEASLGYFINPLFNVLLGLLLLKERLRRWQALAVGIAALGVVNLGWQLQALPWIALSLALSFGLYGLIRKMAPVEPLVGLTIETLLALPVALGYLALLEVRGEGAFLHGGWVRDVLIMAAGLITALPLLWFANAAKRLRFSTLGLFQYLAPSCQMALAVYAYDEPFTPAHQLTFACIWGALALYSADARRALRGR